MGKMTAYTATTELEDSDILLVDGTSGTRKVTAANLAVQLGGKISSVQRRNIYRGASLGTSISDDQLAAIKAGTFEGMFIGDYWTINSVKWTIADMDYWYNMGDTAFATHHLVMIPGLNLYNAVMNDTNTTEGGYVGSQMYTTNLDDAKTTIASAFGDYLLTHREYLSNAVTSGYPSAAAWYDSSVELMNEIMVYGSYIHTPANTGTTAPSIHTNSKQQLSLFRLNPKQLGRSTIWLRDVATASYFAFVGSHGYATRANASASYGVRPVFPIGVAS